MYDRRENKQASSTKNSQSRMPRAAIHATAGMARGCVANNAAAKNGTPIISAPLER